MSNESRKDFSAKLNALRLEHRDLDEVIARLAKENGVDDLQLKRLKRRKLYIKDQISHLERRMPSGLNV